MVVVASVRRTDGASPNSGGVEPELFRVEALGSAQHQAAMEVQKGTTE